MVWRMEDIIRSRVYTILTELSSDPTIRSHLAALYDTLLEQNLLRIVEPYSVVEIDHVAQQVGQGRQSVEAKWVFNNSSSIVHG